METIAIFTTSYLPFIGGAQIAISEITKRNPQFRYVLFCAKLKAELPKHERIGPVEVYRIGLGNGFDKFILPIAGPLLARLTIRSPITVWAVMAQYGGMAAYLYHRLFSRKSKFLLTLQEGGNPREMEKKAGLFLAFMRTILRNTNHLQVISHALLEWARELGYAGSDYHVIPNGVDYNRFATEPPPEELNDLKKKYAPSEKTRIVFSASRLSPKNGMIDLVNATSMLPDNYVTVIAGGGKQEKIIRSRIAELNIGNRVYLLGDRTLDEITKLLHISHVFVRPSLSEGLGNAFLEAMAAGVPIVGTMVGGIKDFLVPGETGMAAEPGNPRSIADSILAYEDQELYNRIQASGRALVGSRFDWDMVASQMGKLFLTQPDT